MKDWNKQAFPIPDNTIPQEGMTLLDYFAGQAMIIGDPFEYDEFEHYANACYKLAKAMIEEREKVVSELENKEA